MRADSILRNLYPGLTRRQVTEAFDNGLVRSSLPACSVLRKHQSLSGPLALDRSLLDAHLASLKRGVDISGVEVLHRDQGFIVVHKPAGVPCVPLGLMDLQTITAWARFHYPEVNSAFTAAQPELAVHRLDTDTEGVLVVALTLEGYQKWRELFAHQDVEKQYRAWVWGRPATSPINLLTPLSVIAGKSKVYLAEEDSRASTIAEAGVETLQWDAKRGISELRITTRSGIRHQVRAQLAFAGHPLVGDRTYDPLFSRRPFQHPYHLLWASRLVTGLGTWTDEPPASWGPLLPSD